MHVSVVGAVISDVTTYKMLLLKVLNMNGVSASLMT